MQTWVQIIDLHDLTKGSAILSQAHYVGGGASTPPAATSPDTGISEAQAKQSATQFLAGYLPGSRIGDGDAFYGYYHFDVLRGIRQVGMLSVNAGSGQVWYHTWHGEFLEKREVDHS